MRILISIFIFVLALTLSARGQAVRNLNGAATNLTLRGILTNSTTVMNGAWIVTNFNTGVVATYGAPGLSLATGGNDTFIATTASGNVSFTGVASGNGAGLTNLGASQPINFTSNVTFSSTVTFNGKVTLTSNVFLSQLSFATNAGAVNVLNLNCTDQALSTNNNVLYSGFNIPAEYGNTNSAWAAVIVTNNSVSAFIMISFVGCIGDTNIYVTNQSAFTVKKYPGFGTNVVARNLK